MVAANRLGSMNMQQQEILHAVPAPAAAGGDMYSKVYNERPQNGATAMNQQNYNAQTVHPMGYAVVQQSQQQQQQPVMATVAHPIEGLNY